MPTDPNADTVAALVKRGVDMIITGNDVLFLNNGLRAAKEAIDAGAPRS
ncbi:hypothetical protein [Primorskyibacter marinus]|nr:hypothetical protein [Primorskyibacter marinus]